MQETSLSELCVSACVLFLQVCGSTLTSCGLRGVLLLSEPPAQSPAGPSQQGDGGAEVTVGGARGALSGLWAGPACRGDVAAGFDGCFAVSSLGAAARAGAVAAYGLSPYAAAAAAPLHCASFVSGTWGGPTAVSIRVVCPAGVEVRSQAPNGQHGVCGLASVRCCILFALRVT